ncbi:hypothetical protein PHYBLDRAFT_111447, partial [Phycomyces blakesleeanus NRRL 1555(-)]
HTAANTRKWLKAEGIEVIDFPPFLPDLNPIENLWVYTKGKLYQYEEPFSLMREL